ncbi:hypothetical protein N7509_001716 [Penicillium cosmopolitanum]|uniref:Uncharacterized protein n=1 Tax=Penicillium cosmopolitanum TaxID=1131564 RepID=A0A9X0BCN3_9EURO|nr:uncharacterized protein N7509_001716 [Penicillium cosmopolitanum]KAJ5407833.1 hypothetical protein N7509_001716 [Penicillium cosmopolitanum]
MPDMHAVFQHAASPPKVDLASANSQLFQLPSSTSASSSLYSLSLSRKRPRRDTATLSSKFDPSSEVHNNASPLISTDFRQPSSEEYHASADFDYRPNRYRESFLPPSLDASVDSLLPAGNSRKRTRRDSNIASPAADTDLPSPATRVGWGRTVINAAGKVLDLCWSGAFKGFYAGGGQGYDMHTGSPAQFGPPPTWQAGPSTSTEKDRIFRTPIPGQYPDEDIDRSWVVVPGESADSFGNDGNDGTDSPSALRARRIHQASSPRRRQAVMPRHAKRPSLSVRPSTPTKSTAIPSPRSQNGPGSAEMQKYAARMRRKEREEDASIQRLNKQLQDMIRQGKEALGTTVEVDDLDMDFQSD